MNTVGFADDYKTLHRTGIVSTCPKMSSVQGLLPGVPLIESPLFEAAIESSQLDEAEREIARKLHRDGFAVLDFPDPLLDERIERIKARLTPRFGLPLDDAGSVKFGGPARVQDAWMFDEDVKEIAVNPEILGLLSRLYGRSAFPFQTLNFPVGTQQAVHTDAVHFSSVPERFMCGVWVAMEDVTADSGPLFYVPGSHRWPTLANALIGRKGFGATLGSAQDPYQETWDALIAASGAREEVFLARKGQAVIWCANLLHGGSRQHDERLTRWSQVTHYYFDDCVYYTPAFSDECLGRLALRNIVNVADGQLKPNLYLGEIVGPPESKPVSGWSNLARRCRKALRKGWLKRRSS